MNTSVKAKALCAVAAVAALSGCVAVPADGYYDPAPVVYAPPPVMYGPPRVYYGPPAYYGPSVRFGVYGGHRHYHGYRGGRRWR